jgi:hypothetical protein
MVAVYVVVEGDSLSCEVGVLVAVDALRSAA